jgi:hypothetical protein
MKSKWNCMRACYYQYTVGDGRLGEDVEEVAAAEGGVEGDGAGDTRLETICPGTSKIACWRVQLSTASKVGCRGAGTATASIEASLLVGDISHPPAQMVPFMLADELCRPPA